MKELQQELEAVRAEIVIKRIDYDALNNSNRKLAEANARIVEFEDIKKGHLKVQDKLQQELDAARAEIELYKGCEFTWAQTRRTEIMVKQQLADALAKAKDYESALNGIMETCPADPDLTARFYESWNNAVSVLNKWRAK